MWQERTASGWEVFLWPRPLASAAMLLQVQAGSRDEAAHESGWMHALEHMLFKGAGELDADAIARRLDALGGRIDAWTSREQIVLEAHIAREDAAEALRLLLQLALSPSLPAHEWERERGVILSEIAMSEDDPFDWGLEKHLQAAFAGDGFGRSVLGTPQTLKRCRCEDLQALHRRFFVRERLRLFVAGGFNASEVLKVCNEVAPPAGNSAEHPMPRLLPGVRGFAREAEQLIVYASVVQPRDDRRWEAQWLLHQVLGGGNSSLLFERLRQKHGLAYTVSASIDRFDAFTLSTIELACAPEKAEKAVRLLAQTLATLPEKIDAERLALAKRQALVSLALAEDHAPSLASMLLHEAPNLRSMQARRQAIEAVSIAEVRNEAARLCALSWAVSFVGPKDAIEAARRAWSATG